MQDPASGAGKEEFKLKSDSVIEDMVHMGGSGVDDIKDRTITIDSEKPAQQNKRK